MKDKASRCIPLSETNAQIKESESNLHVLFFNQRKYPAFYSINNWLVASSFILLPILTVMEEIEEEIYCLSPYCRLVFYLKKKHENHFTHSSERKGVENFFRVSNTAFLRNKATPSFTVFSRNSASLCSITLHTYAIQLFSVAYYIKYL